MPSSYKNLDTKHTLHSNGALDRSINQNAKAAVQMAEHTQAINTRLLIRGKQGATLLMVANTQAEARSHLTLLHTVINTSEKLLPRQHSTCCSLKFCFFTELPHVYVYVYNIAMVYVQLANTSRQTSLPH